MLLFILPLFLPHVVSSASTADRLLRRDALSTKIQDQWSWSTAAAAPPPPPTREGPLSGSSDVAWDEVVGWLTSLGATVSPKIKSNVTQHGGFEVRGVVAAQNMEKSETLLSIPKPLWLHIDNIDVDGLDHLECKDAEYLKHAIAIASEDRKGKLSRYHPYLKNLPDLENYKSFYLNLATPETLKNFEGLPIVEKVRNFQARDARLKQCFQEWQTNYGTSDLVWNDVLLGLVRWRTRSYSVKVPGKDRDTALIPASDLMNTAKRELLNTHWSVKEPSPSSAPKLPESLPTANLNRSEPWLFQVRTSKEVHAGDELYDSYCINCGNTGFLWNWGIYMEDNPKAKKSKALSKSESAPLKSEATPLKLAVLPMLQKSSYGLTAPRCTSSVLQQPQGPVRCALARLAWEQFADAWGVRDSQSLLAADEGESFELGRQIPGQDLIFDSRGIVQTEPSKT